MLIEHDNPDVPLTRQCGLMKLPRSSLYYRSDGAVLPRGGGNSTINLRLLVQPL